MYKKRRRSSDEARCCIPDAHRARLAETAELPDLIVSVRADQAIAWAQPDALGAIMAIGTAKSLQFGQGLWLHLTGRWRQERVRPCDGP
jgi:hypothetical protein